MPPSHNDSGAFEARGLARRARPLIALLTLVALAVGLVWWHAGAIFLLFSSFLFFVGASTAGRWIAGKLGLYPRATSITLVFATVLALVVAAVGIGRPFATQAGQLAEQGPRALRSVIEQAWRLPWVSAVLGARPEPSQMLQVGQQALQSVPTIASGALDVAAALVVWFFVALYLTFDPGAYAAGVLRLFAPSRRARVAEIGEEIVEKLGRWILARGLAMIVAFVLTTVGLWALHVPMWLALGVIAGLFTFVDYAGAVASAVPAILVGLSKSPATALGVIGVFLVVHLVDGYVLTPLIVKRAVHLPPAFTLGSQVLLGSLFGVAGIALATPIAVVLVTIVRRAYIESYLGDLEDAHEREHEGAHAPSLPATRRDVVARPSVA